MATVVTHSLVAEIDGHRILHGVDLAVEQGAWVNVIGPNGAGKTTLLRCLLGTLEYEGTIELDGAPLTRPADRACRVAYVPQTPVIPPGMAVSDYVLLGRTPHRGIFARETDSDLRIASNVLERLDLDGFAGREVRSLSGGERQRVVLARALAQQAPVLLLDEPTTALDLGHREAVLRAIREYAGAVLFATHDLDAAAAIADRIVVLERGVIVMDGPPRVVLTEELLRDVFEVEARVIEDEGRLHVLL